MVSSLVYERRQKTVERAKDLKESAEMHRRIYQSIRDHDPERARSEMGAHLDLARQAQATEEAEPSLKASEIVDLPAAPEAPVALRRAAVLSRHSDDTDSRTQARRLRLARPLSRRSSAR